MFKAVVYGQAVRQDTIEIAKLRRFPTWFRWIDRDDVVKLRDAVNWKKKKRRDNHGDRVTGLIKGDASRFWINWLVYLIARQIDLQLRLNDRRIQISV